ncbi:MAG TPA: hypothetical protein VMB73_13475 [Acetobacteraceae bacterium]|jgi:hypothetical protein|nr:hypothetical protein [Acetobacteraceae bacterium]
MFRWFRRADPEDEFEDEADEVPLPEQIDFGEPVEFIPEIRPLPKVPDFAAIVAETAVNGWHMAAVVTDATGPDFYVRAITVRWPFMVARPVPSTRLSHKPVKPSLRSPTGSTPARKCIVNWGWAKLEESFSQLRFYIKRERVWWLPGTGPATIRLTLKESGYPRRRIVVPIKTNVIDWNRMPPGAETPASPPEQST